MEANTPDSTAPVALWNPNVAALWSVIFTPVFGAYLHALNWRALGDAERERTSMGWVYVGGVMLVVFMLLEMVVPSKHIGNSVSQTVGFAFLLVWYFAAGYSQAKLVKEKFGGTFARKSWKKPLLWGLAGFATYIAVMVAIAAVIGLNNL